MSDIDYNNIEILEPVGINRVCQELAKSAIELPFISNSFGRVFRHVSKPSGQRVSKPYYFNRSGQNGNFNYIDLSANRDFCKPAFSFCYPYGAKRVEDENGQLNYFKQRISFFVVLKLDAFDLASLGYNHIFLEEIINDLLIMINKLTFFTEITVYDDYKEVWKDFDINFDSSFMYPYATLRFDMLANFQECKEVKFTT